MKLLHDGRGARLHITADTAFLARAAYQVTIDPAVEATYHIVVFYLQAFQWFPIVWSLKWFVCTPNGPALRRPVCSYMANSVRLMI